MNSPGGLKTGKKMSERTKQIDARVNELQAERQARDVMFIERIKRLLDSPEVVALKNRCPIARLKHVIVEWESYREGEQAEYDDLFKELIFALKEPVCDDGGWTCPHCGTQWHDGWKVCNDVDCMDKAARAAPESLNTLRQNFQAAARERAPK